MTTDLLTKLENGEIEVETGSGINYEDAEIEITNAKLVYADNQEDLYPLNQDWAKGQICLRVDLKIYSDSYPQGKTYPFADTYTGKNSDKPIAYSAYASKNEVDDNGLPKIVKGKLLWELKNSIAEYDSDSIFNQEGWTAKFKPSDLIGKKFRMRVRYAQKKNLEEFVILETSYQKLTDIRFFQLKEREKKENNNEVVENNEDFLTSIGDKQPF